MRVKELFAFIKEREAVRIKKESGAPRPWTTDKIFQQWRFCNVRREDDKVTIWIREHWRNPHAEDPDLWFSMTVARLLNLPVSLKAIGYPVPWNPKQFKSILHKKKENGDIIFSGAYMIRADAVESGLKTDYLADFVLTPMWNDRACIRPRKTDTLAAFHSRLMEYRDMGSFMAGQVTCDTKQVGVLKKAIDWWTWAAPGPGSMRGLNRIVGRPIIQHWKPGEWLQTLNVLQTKLNSLLKEAGMPRMCAQDTQSCNCEFDKYERVRLGEGRPKQRYNGGA